MRKTLVAVASLALIPLVATGCVSKSEYTKSVLAADQVEQELRALQGRYDMLQRDNASLKSDYAGAVQQHTRGSAERVELEKALKTKSDELARNLAELRSQIASLEDEKARLARERDEAERAKAEAQRAKDEKLREVSSTYEQLLDKMKTEISQGQVTISELKGKLTVNMVEAILFDSGRAEVKAGGLVILGKVIEILKTVDDKAIRIEGHTDNVPISGTLARRYPTNWELSAARAINVARYLQEQAIDAASLSATAFGEFKPVSDNSTPEGRAQNRRIEIVLVPKE
ncbi:MAG: OmpA family protein [Candidatus Rokuibacteriota bacterium]